MKKKLYLGDSVYAEATEFGIKLTTNNGYKDSNTIVLESDVLINLVRFAQRHEYIEELIK